jgi:3-hydroxybutyrate dehydrogenase
MRLTDQVVVVTGGASGIGQGISRHLPKEGARVVIWDINLRDAQMTADSIQSQGGQAVALEVDVTDKAQVGEAVTSVLNRYGKIDVLVNNAGVEKKCLIVDYEEDMFDKVIAVNLKGVFLCTQAVLPSMIERRYGRIIMISSMSGKMGEPYTGPYCMTKWGLLGFTQTLALEVGKYNITANAICPGPTETPMIEKVIRDASKIKGVTEEQFKQTFYIDLTPLGRLTKPLDIAKAVVFLASEDAEFITGASLNVSGGRDMH